MTQKKIDAAELETGSFTMVTLVECLQKYIEIHFNQNNQNDIQ